MRKKGPEKFDHSLFSTFHLKAAASAELSMFFFVCGERNDLRREKPTFFCLFCQHQNVAAAAARHGRTPPALLTTHFSIIVPRMIIITVNMLKIITVNMLKIITVNMLIIITVNMLMIITVNNVIQRRKGRTRHEEPEQGSCSQLLQSKFFIVLCRDAEMKKLKNSY